MHATAAILEWSRPDEFAKGDRDGSYVGCSMPFRRRRLALAEAGMVSYELDKTGHIAFFKATTTLDI